MARVRYTAYFSVMLWASIATRDDNRTTYKISDFLAKFQNDLLNFIFSAVSALELLKFEISRIRYHIRKMRGVDVILD